MSAPSHHLRQSNAGMQLIHYVDNRTMRTLCGQSALDWNLVLTNDAAPTCEKCRKLLDNVELR